MADHAKTSNAALAGQARQQRRISYRDRFLIHIDTVTFMIIQLQPQDLDAIMQLELLSFDAAIQASRNVYLKRFALCHTMLAARAASEQSLRGIISFSYGRFDPAHPAAIPDNFAAWSQQPVPPNYDSVFIYNLGVAPGERGRICARELVAAALQRARRDGCVRALAECPIPSYAGNRHVRQAPALRAALDAYAGGGAAPPDSLLFKDPHLRFYRKLYDCRVAAIMPGFLLEDVASGGYRAMLWAAL